MAVNNINVGIDYTFGYYESNTNQIINFGDIETFKEDAMKHDIKSMPYNNYPRYGYIPDGYKGTFSIKRVGAQLDLLQIQLIQLFNNAGMVNSGYINKVTQNTDGTYSRFQYIRAVFWMNQVSSGSRDKEIVQEVEWKASDLVVIS